VTKGLRTTHTLTRTSKGEWELCSDHAHGITKPLTTIRAVTPEVAMTRAEVWLDVNGNGAVRGDYWAKSRGWSDRWALRISQRHADGDA
jgi:hypothetical protein